MRAAKLVLAAVLALALAVTALVGSTVLADATPPRAAGVVSDRAPALASLRALLDGLSGRFHRSSPPCCGREPGPAYDGDVEWHLQVTASACDLVLSYSDLATRTNATEGCGLRRKETLHLAALTSVGSRAFPEREGAGVLTSAGLTVQAAGAAPVVTFDEVLSRCGNSPQSRLAGSEAKLLRWRGVEAARARAIVDALRDAARACGAVMPR